MTVREETKEWPAFALVLGGQGAKLTDATDKNDFRVAVMARTGIPERPDFMRAYNATMTLFACAFDAELERPVYDQTGLKELSISSLSTLRDLRIQRRAFSSSPRFNRSGLG